MANLKNLIVNGVTRFVGKAYAQTPDENSNDTQIATTAFVQQGFVDKNSITNCILEAPNGVMVLASDGINFTLKQGLKVLVPNGRNADGTLKNTETTLASDVVYTKLTTSVLNLTYYVFVDELGAPHTTAFYYLAKDIDKDNYISANNYVTYFAIDSNKMYLYDYTDTTWKERTWAFVGTIAKKSAGSTVHPEQPICLLKQSDRPLLIEWGMPDYTAAVNITSSKKAPSDGLCCYQGSCNAGQYITALVNGNSVGRITGTQLTGNTATLLFSVSKNDVISSQASYNIISEELIFYPFKGAT